MVARLVLYHVSRPDRLMYCIESPDGTDLFRGQMFHSFSPWTEYKDAAHRFADQNGLILVGG